nr:aminoacyl-tRNA synthetase, class 1a, anticodon-binding [Tanacetum cinerariifolium]
MSRAQTKTIIASLQNELQSNIYKNAKLRTQLFKKVSDQKDNTQDMSKNTKFAKQPIVENLPKVGKTNALSKPVTSNSVSTPQESNSMNNDKVIAQGMFRINPFKTYREEKQVPNTVSASARTKPIIVSQPHVITKKDVNSDLNGLSSIGDVISKVVCAKCKKCLISVNHDECVRNYVNGKISHVMEMIRLSVTSLENEIGITKKFLGGAVLKLVTRVKRLEGLLRKRKRRLVLSDSEGKEAATKEQDIDLDAFHKLATTSLGGDSTVEAAYTIYKASQDAHASSDAGHAAAEVPDDTTMPFRRMSTTRRHLRKPFASSASEHFQENISAVEDTLLAGEGIHVAAPTIPAGGTTIPAGRTMVPTVLAAAVAPSSTILAADKGKAPMVDDSLHADLLFEQEHILKNLHDYQLGEELAKKLHAEQEAEFTRQQEELAQKAQAERLLCDDVNEENMNERLDMLLIRKRRELVKQSRVKELSLSQLKHEFEYIQRTLERSNLHNFKRTTFRPAPSLEAPSAKQARQEVPQDVLAASSQVPAVIFVPAAPSVAANVSVPAVAPVPAVPTHVDTEVHAEESTPDDNPTASEQVSVEHTVAASTPSSSRKRRKHLAKKRVTPILDIADDALIKFDSASDSDDDPLPYVPYAGWEMVPSPLGSIHAYYDVEGHTKHFTSLCELLHMVERNDLRRLLGAVDNLYQREEPDTFALLLWGDLQVLFQSLDDEDARDFWLNQDGWLIRSWRLYPRAQVHVLETVDGRVIYMFLDVSYPLSSATLQHMLKHGLEVLKLLVGRDLTMAEQLVTQNWMVFTFHVPFWIKKWLVQGGTTLELASPERMATGKDVSNPFMAVMVCQKPLGYFSSPLIHVPRAGLTGCCCYMILLSLMFLLFVLAGFFIFYWFLVAAVWLFAAVLVCSCCWNKDAILELTRLSCKADHGPKTGQDRARPNQTGNRFDPKYWTKDRIEMYCPCPGQPGTSRFLWFLANKREKGELMQYSIDNCPYKRKWVDDLKRQGEKMLEPIKDVSTEDMERYYADIKCRPMREGKNDTWVWGRRVTWNVGGVSGTVPVDAGTLYRAVGEMGLFGGNGGYMLVRVLGFGRLGP